MNIRYFFKQEKSCLNAENYSKYAFPKKVQELKVPISSSSGAWDSEEMIWVNRPQKTAGRKKEPHIFRGANVNGQVRREYRELKTPMEIFNVLFDEPMLEIILGISGKIAHAFTLCVPGRGVNTLPPLQTGWFFWTIYKPEV